MTAQFVTSPFKPGDVIQQYFTLKERIGAGSFGEIFHATYDNHKYSKEVAIKFEKYNPQRLLLFAEVQTLSVVGGKPNFPKFYHAGSEGDYRFYAMELLGPSLIDLINQKPPYRFSIATIVNIDIQAIEALRLLHRHGFIHRDVKPGNFVIGRTPETSHTVYLIDYGLCKPILPPEQYKRSLAHKTTFRGTVRYASLTTHYGRELTRRDDLISLMYMSVELVVGRLPWTDMTDKDEIAKMKEKYEDDSLLKQLPIEYSQIYSHILSVGPTQEPDYAYYISLLRKVGKRMGFDQNSCFDWERPTVNNEKKNRNNIKIAPLPEKDYAVLARKMHQKRIESERQEALELARKKIPTIPPKVEKEEKQSRDVTTTSPSSEKKEDQLSIERTPTMTPPSQLSTSSSNSSQQTKARNTAILLASFHNSPVNHTPLNNRPLPRPSLLSASSKPIDPDASTRTTTPPSSKPKLDQDETPFFSPKARNHLSISPNDPPSPAHSLPLHSEALTSAPDDPVSPRPPPRPSPAMSHTDDDVVTLPPLFPFPAPSPHLNLHTCVFPSHHNNHQSQLFVANDSTVLPSRHFTSIFPQHLDNSLQPQQFQSTLDLRSVGAEIEGIFSMAIKPSGAAIFSTSTLTYCDDVFGADELSLDPTFDPSRRSRPANLQFLDSSSVEPASLLHTPLSDRSSHPFESTENHLPVYHSSAHALSPPRVVASINSPPHRSFGFSTPLHLPFQTNNIDSLESPTSQQFVGTPFSKREPVDQCRSTLVRNPGNLERADSAYSSSSSQKKSKSQTTLRNDLSHSRFSEYNLIVCDTTVSANRDSDFSFRVPNTSTLRTSELTPVSQTTLNFPDKRRSCLPAISHHTPGPSELEPTHEFPKDLSALDDEFRFAPLETSSKETQTRETSAPNPNNTCFCILF
ncbi:putative Tau-tubulin kinase [Blattamonas nauphoetae]|uniref:non-specific serine/threonine protein kinase n=1 Tax=Blattamonas nauphoetae TaxID=2049346 RepID=A0ABQ9XWL4_9EUKA|nr:putative Tau-tubulin kinase [Blattamonas nauphoetae]